MVLALRFLDRNVKPRSEDHIGWWPMTLGKYCNCQLLYLHWAKRGGGWIAQQTETDQFLHGFRGSRWPAYAKTWDIMRAHLESILQHFGDV